MSPPPSNPDEISQLAKDITVSSAIGASAMLSRILVSDGKQSVLYYVSRMTAAAIVSIFVGLYLTDVIESLTMRYAAVGLAGAAAPEIINFGIKRALKFITKV
jgi:hypothetical protein